MNVKPTISVILPVYNAGPYLNESIDSILNQSFEQFELLIFDDASTDNSGDIIRSYKDARIVYRKGEKNEGLVKMLNKGLEEASGKYIARMDADDICMPSRFEEQVAFMEQNQLVGICGTWYENFGTNVSTVKGPVTPEEAEFSMFFGSPVGHPTVMIRSELLKTHVLEYDHEYLFAEDYDLFERAACFFPVLNIPKVLLKYRKHPTQITHLRWQYQYYLAGKIQARHMLRALNHPKPEDITWMENLFVGRSIINDQWFDQLEEYKKKLIAENTVYTRSILSKVVDVLFEDLKKKNIADFFNAKYYSKDKFTPALLRSFLNEQYKPGGYLKKKITLFFMIKCLLGYSKRKEQHEIKRTFEKN